MHDHNLFADIKKLLIETKLVESHTTEEIKDLSTSELKKLHKEYLAKDTDEAKKEADEIKKEIESRGEDEGEEKADVAQQNEELLAILDTLCEMAGLDMMTLVEETRKEMQNLGHAYSWDKPAPVAAPHGKLAANARDVIVKAVMARGTRNERAAREREQFRAGPKFAQTIADAGKDVHEREDGRVVTGLEALGGFDRIQSDIDEIERKVSDVENERKMSPTMRAHVENLRRLAKPPAKKTKGKGKK